MEPPSYRGTWWRCRGSPAGSLDCGGCWPSGYAGVRSPMAPLMLSWGSAAATGGRLRRRRHPGLRPAPAPPLSALRTGRVSPRVAPARSAATRTGACSRERPRLRALPPCRRGLRSSFRSPLPALENEGLVRLHDPGTPTQRYRRQEAVAPAMRRARRNPAAPGSLPDRLASEAPCASRRFPLSGSDLLDGHRLPECGGPDQADDRPAIEAARLKPPPMLFWDPPNQHPQASRTGAQEQLNRPLATTSEQLRERDDAGRLLSRWMAISPVEGRRAGERVRR